MLDIQNDLYQVSAPQGGVFTAGGACLKLSPFSPQSPLHLAVYLGQEEVVEALVIKDVNLELQDRKGDTALHLACEKEQLRCARILLRGPRGPQNLQLQNWKGDPWGSWG